MYIVVGAYPHHVVQAQEDGAAKGGYYNEAVIYFNEACSGCTEYLYEDLEKTLQDYSFSTVSFRDYINESSYRSELNSLSKDLGIPFDLESHIMTFVGDDIINDGEINADNIRVVLAGHIPEEMTKNLISKNSLNEQDRIIVYQDKMPNMETVENYQAWAFGGPIREYDIDEPIATYIDWYHENESSFGENTIAQDSWSWQKLLPTIMITGFLDGLNPCAFAVLLLFISYLFTIKKARRGILKMGIIYISAVYLAYLLIGIGLLKAILTTGVPHFMAWVGSILVMLLGFLNLINYFFPKFPIKLKIPDFSKGIISEYMYKATMPAAFILGFVVGLCTFPCSGGPYVAIITMLSSQTDWIQGFSYLLLYNLMFVTPLIVLLALSGNKYATEKLHVWESGKSKYMHLLSSLLMIAIGLVIIIFFI